MAYYGDLLLLLRFRFSLFLSSPVTLFFVITVIEPVIETIVSMTVFKINNSAGVVYSNSQFFSAHRFFVHKLATDSAGFLIFAEKSAKV